jgi:hypothetical protein
MQRLVGGSFSFALEEFSLVVKDEREIAPRLNGLLLLQSLMLEWLDDLGNAESAAGVCPIFDFRFNIGIARALTSEVKDLNQTTSGDRRGQVYFF